GAGGANQEVVYGPGAGGVLWKESSHYRAEFSREYRVPGTTYREPCLAKSEIDLSSSDNPQFEPHLEPVHAEMPVVPSTAGEMVSTTTPATPAVPPPVEDPVWNGWDVLLIAGLTLLTLFIVEFATVIAARLLFYPAANLAEVAQKPVLALIGEFLSYIA